MALYTRTLALSCILAFTSGSGGAKQDSVEIVYCYSQCDRALQRGFTSAFTLPLRASAGSMNPTMKDRRSYLTSLRRSSSFPPRSFPPLPAAKRGKDNAKVYNAIDLILYSILALILYSHSFCWQNQNQFDLEFSIVINMRGCRRGRWARARARAKYEWVLI